MRSLTSHGALVFPSMKWRSNTPRGGGGGLEEGLLDGVCEKLSHAALHVESTESFSVVHQNSVPDFITRKTLTVCGPREEAGILQRPEPKQRCVV